MPVKAPDVPSMVPTEGVLLTQVPPPAVLLSTMVAPAQAPRLPVELLIVPGNALTVTTTEMVQPVVL